jgi:hypothetical protein
MVTNEEKKQRCLECLEILKKMWDLAVEAMKDEAEEKHCTFADLIAEARERGTEITPLVEQLILFAEGKI